MASEQVGATTTGSETAQKEMPLGRTSLAELALLFLRLGSAAFGGPAAHIAMMRDEIVRRRKWLTEEHFLDLLGATNLIPGPNSTEKALHIGWNRRRWSGLVVAGVTFILPAMLITGLSGGHTFGSGSCPKRRGCSGESSRLTEAVGIAKVVNLAGSAAAALVFFSCGKVDWAGTKPIDAG